MRCIFAFTLLTICVSADRYNDQWARQLLSISAAGFAKNPTICIKKTFPDSNWVLINDNRKFDGKINGNVTTFAIANHQKKQIIISFTVTEPKDESNYKSLFGISNPVRFYEFGNVQPIFFELEEEIWKFVQQVIGYEDYHKYNVAFTGYSLGGAVATLAAMRTIGHGLRTSSQIELITFGEPRVGTLVFANSVNKEIPHKFRVTHGGDLVVHLPPCRNLGNASCSINHPNAPSHHGTEVFYDNDMRNGSFFMKCVAKDEDERCSNSKYKNQNFRDHEYYFQHKVVSYGEYDCTDVKGIDSGATSSQLSTALPIAFFVLANYY